MLSFLYRHRLTIFLTGLIVVLSLLPVPKTSLQHVHHFDKFVHFLIYASYSLSLWIEVRAPRPWIFLWTIAFPIVVGGTLEVAQALLTATRHADKQDMMANILGVILALPPGLYLHRRLPH